MKSTNRANLALIVGLILVGLTIAVSLIGPFLAPADPQETSFIYETPDGEFVLHPIEPNTYADHPLGTDVAGRDFLSRWLWAFYPTLGLAALITVVRAVLGAGMGYVRGWYPNGRLADTLDLVTQTATTIPLILVAIVSLQLTGWSGLGAWPFILALNITGWVNISDMVAQRLRILREQPYIQAARSLGAGEWHILIKHIIPNMRHLAPVLLTLEMGIVLIQLAELGFLRFVFGGNAIINIGGPSTEGLDIAIQGQPELAQILSYGWDNFFIAPWISMWAAGGFFVLILGFMMLGEGLKRYYQTG
ncbi:MAG: ABC transporter permease [Chloroflexi bacterium]|nr:ABC transporter permease [Chloroflexota bacterium]